jgi:integrase
MSIEHPYAHKPREPNEPHPVKNRPSVNLYHGFERRAHSEWSVVEQSSKQIGIERFGAHDLRRTCAKLCRKNGGDLEQIKFLLGHSPIQTTERYLGSEQEIAIAVNDNLGPLTWGEF